jgi:hypothetical protein
MQGFRLDRPQQKFASTVIEFSLGTRTRAVGPRRRAAHPRRLEMGDAYWARTQELLQGSSPLVHKPKVRARPAPRV